MRVVFSSQLFLFLFLPFFLLIYYLTPSRHRNLAALFASLIFYAWGAPRFVFVLVGCAVLDYNLSHGVYRARKPAARKGWLTVSLVLNIGLLAFFKYANFGVEQFNGLLHALGLAPMAWTRVALPIGISFFIFHKISYMMDVYRGVTAPARRFSTYLLYLVFFPQLIAGPIIRYHDVAGQLDYRRHSSERFLSGIWRFCRGLGKKVLIANALGEVVDSLFQTTFATVTPLHAWIGMLSYAFQIYFDFSGYSDMAIGLGRMAGIEFLENFNEPYTATSFTDFWRRWHISLSNFMREYLYIPLGGNRVAPWRAYLNLWIVFLISGLWHGAAWTFVAWGAFHGLFLTLDKFFWLRLSARLPKLITVPLTFVLILVGWTLFRSDHIGEAGALLLRMLAVTHASQPPPLWADVISHRATLVFWLAALISFAPAVPAVRSLLVRASAAKTTGIWVARHALALVLLILSVCSLANANFNPFIYFRF